MRSLLLLHTPISQETGAISPRITQTVVLVTLTHCSAYTELSYFLIVDSAQSAPWANSLSVQLRLTYQVHSFPLP